MKNVNLIRTLEQVTTSCGFSANECLEYRHAPEFVKMSYVVISLSRATSYAVVANFERTDPLIRYMITILEDLVVEAGKASLPSCRLAEASCNQCINACEMYLNQREYLRVL